MTQSYKYQPELDGLRALAVSLVLLFHAGGVWLPGGYVGVDVFFVLSGFLITRILVEELSEEGRIRFGRFYLRRIRRLFPALLCTVVVSCFGAFLLLSPELIVGFFRSAGAALLSISNFFFWWQVDYFDVAGNTKPLLHTWSLSVEEQFYLIWPVTLFVLWRFCGRLGAWIGLFLLAVTSLIWSEWLLERDRAGSFFLLPSRMIELAIGALLVWAPSLKKPSLQEASMALGIAAILAAATLFDEKTPFPGLAALLPCLGAALFIVGAKAPLMGHAFRLRPVVWLGKISYSLYLVHWPVVVFFIAYTFRIPSQATDIALICCLSVLLAWVQYRLVERPFRYPGESNRVFVLGVSIAACLVAVSTLALSLTEGLAWRLPDERKVLSDRLWRRMEHQNYCQNWSPGFDKSLITCQNYRQRGRDIFIWGDSHALHLVAGFSEAFPDYNIHILHMDGCTPQSGFAGYVRDMKSARTEVCLQRNERAIAFFEDLEPTNIILTSAKRSSPEIIARATKVVMDELLPAGHNVVVMGDFIRPGLELASCVATPAYLIDDQALRRRCVGDRKRAAKELAYNARLAELLPDIVLPDAIQCPNDQCAFFKEETLLYRDSHHLNVDGSIKMIAELRHLIPIGDRDGMPDRQSEPDEGDGSMEEP